MTNRGLVLLLVAFILGGFLAFLVSPFNAQAAAVSWDRPAVGRINPINILDTVFGNIFTATSTTAASTFPFASTTVTSATTVCLSTDCRTVWPSGLTPGGTAGQVQYKTSANTFGGVATGTVSNGTGISVTAGQSVIGSGLTITNTGVTSNVAGTGISLSGSTGAVTITNTAPDQTVVLTPGTGISTSGTYPNFTITNTAPLTFSYPFPNSATSSALTLGGLTLSNITGSTQCLHVNSSGVVSGTSADCGTGSGGVTSVSTTYPLQTTGATGAITLSTAFGTTTSNTFAGTQTFTNSPVFSTLGAGTVNATAAGAVYNTATTSLSVGSPLTVTGTLGALIGGSNSTINCQAASGSQAGCLSSTDWTTFNNKQAAGTYVTSISVNSSNGFAGSSSGGATPALTLTTTISGVLKGNGTAISAASNGTDYTLLTANTCGAGQFFNSATAAGILGCGTPAGTTYTGIFPIVVTGSVISFGGLATSSPFAANQSVYTNNAGSLVSIATSTPTVSAPITYSGTLGSFVGGSSGAFACTNASAGVTGCLTGTDWSTFNNKQSTLVGTQGQVAYFSGSNSAVGTSSLFIAPSGNVGIGTTSPQKPFHVEGTTSGGVARIQRDVAAAASSVYGTYDVTLNETGGLQDKSGPAQTFSVQNNGNTGNILGDIYAIRQGADTTGAISLRSYFTGSPDLTLTVDSNQDTVAIASTTPGASCVAEFCLAGTSVAGLTSVAGTTAPVTGFFSSSVSAASLQVGTITNHAIQFFTNNSLKATIINTGQFGIGTTTPGTLLSLGNTGNSTINIDPTATSTFGGGGINLRSGCFAISGVCLSAGGSTLTGTQGQVAYFSGTNTAIGTSSIFILPNGNVGIASTTASALLAVGTQVPVTSATIASSSIWSSPGTYNYTAPPGTAYVQIAMWGAGGGNGNSSGGGSSGAYIGSSTMIIAAGQTATIYVAQGGQNGTGGNGYRKGGNGDGAGGGGGGSSAFTASSTGLMLIAAGGAGVGAAGASTCGTTSGGAGANGSGSADAGGGGGAGTVGANASSNTGGAGGTGASIPTGTCGNGGSSASGRGGSSAGISGNGSDGNTAGTGSGGAANGVNGSGYDSGGGGGAAQNGGSPGGGAGNGALNGGSGKVIVTAYGTNNGNNWGPQFIAGGVTIDPADIRIGTTTPLATITSQSPDGVVSLAIAGFIGASNYIFERIDQFGHLITSGPAPTVSTCTGFSTSAGADDRTGTIAMSSGLTCSFNFAKVWQTAPVCVVSPNSSASTIKVTTSITGVSVTFGTVNTGFAYICQGHQ